MQCKANHVTPDYLFLLLHALLVFVHVIFSVSSRCKQEEPADYAAISALPPAPAVVGDETFQGNPFDGNPFAEPGEVQPSVEPDEPAAPADQAKEPEKLEEPAESSAEPAWSPADPTPDLASRGSGEFEESSERGEAEPSAFLLPVDAGEAAAEAAAEHQLSAVGSGAGVPEASKVPVEAGEEHEQLGEEGISADSSPEAIAEGDGLVQHPRPQLGKNEYSTRLTLRSLRLKSCTCTQKPEGLCGSLGTASLTLSHPRPAGRVLRPSRLRQWWQAD